MQKFLLDEGGATAIEYALLAMMVGVVIITPLILLATATNELYGTVDVGVGGIGGSGDAGGSLSVALEAGSGGGDGSGTGTGFM